MLEVVVRKEVELVQKVLDIYTAERIHLGKGENARESYTAVREQA